MQVYHERWNDRSPNGQETRGQTESVATSSYDRAGYWSRCTDPSIVLQRESCRWEIRGAYNGIGSSVGEVLVRRERAMSPRTFASGSRCRRRTKRKWKRDIRKITLRTAVSHKDRVAGETIYQTNERTNESWRGTNIYTTVDNTMLEESYDAYIKYLTNILKEKKKSGGMFVFRE